MIEVLQVVGLVVWGLINVGGLFSVLYRYIFNQYTKLGNYCMVVGFVGTLIGVLVTTLSIRFEGNTWYKDLTKTHKLKE